LKTVLFLESVIQKAAEKKSALAYRNSSAMQQELL